MHTASTTISSPNGWLRYIKGHEGMLIIDNNYPEYLHNQKNIRIFALRKVRNDINVIAIAWTISQEE